MMLVLSRKPNDQIRIGDDVIIQILRVDGDRVRIGISAPRSMAVHRGEVYAEIQMEKQESKTE